MRAMSYDRSLNEKNAIQALDFVGSNLRWHRLDDGVMGGKSETILGSTDKTLHFKGIINTDGGGFASMRTTIADSVLTNDICALRLKFRGDGKTYKFLMSDGSRSTGGPFAKRPTWQIDIPTKNMRAENVASFEELILPFKDFKPSFGGRSSSKPSAEEMNEFILDTSEIKLFGIMISLRLSDGSPNPPETFGTGMFDFNLDICSITPVYQLS